MSQSYEIYKILSKHDKFPLVNDIYLLSNFRKKEKGSINIIKVTFIYLCSYLFFGILFLINLIYNNVEDDSKEIAIARVGRAIDKIRKIDKEIYIYTDDIKNRDFNMLRVGTRLKRLHWFVFRYSIDNYRYYKESIEIIIELKKENNVNLHSKDLSHLLAKIPHCVLYEYSIMSILDSENLLRIYSSQMRDRFALIEKKCAEKKEKEIICIPHGVEVALKLPGGYNGTKFYCTSKEMMFKLNDLYATKKFVYNYELMRKIFSVKNNYDKGVETKRNVIIFTQPTLYNMRDEENLKSIFKEINNKLKEHSITTKIKVHPLEDKSKYLNLKMPIIESVEEAIVGNICIALNSTVLLECLYNNSKPISIIYLTDMITELTGENEYLNDKRIYKPRNIKDLVEYIKNLMLESF